jgi:TfoX/Sxy family transcriptional regulator of competence genes
MVPAGSAVEVKPMFGNLGAFVNGKMFMGLFGSDVGVKLDDLGRVQLLEEPGTGPFGPVERPMAGYVTIPRSWRERPEAARPWVEKALARSEVLPTRPKASRPK